MADDIQDTRKMLILAYKISSYFRILHPRTTNSRFTSLLSLQDVNNQNFCLGEINR